MAEVFDIFWLVMLSAVKFALAPGLSVLRGFNFIETVLITTSGGALGTITFYFFGEFLITKYSNWRKGKRKVEKVKKTFSRTNKLIVKTKISYGLIGLALITPILLSIPVGSIVAARFFRKNKRTLPLLLFAVVFWSFVLSSLFSLGFIDAAE